ncbi:hypothetical protein, partial [Aminobacter sp. BE322]|uniref:hypothetical protein n=1 Tax=unclassified Aminobacter TaxID=2644704 RepID=UPI003D1FF5E3
MAGSATLPAFDMLVLAAVLSSLKSVLETGRGVELFAKRKRLDSLPPPCVRIEEKCRVLPRAPPDPLRGSTLPSRGRETLRTSPAPRSLSRLAIVKERSRWREVVREAGREAEPAD